MKFCLPPAEAERFKKKLRSGDIDLHKLAEMTSSERHDLFAANFGPEVATEMNLLLEQKLLLKNQKAGIVAWAKKMMAAPKYDSQRNDILKKVQSMDKLLNPKDEDSFLQELASERLGMTVSYEEAKDIAELAEDVKTTKEAMENAPRREMHDGAWGPATPEEMAHGLAVTDLRGYVDEMVLDANKLQISDFRSHPFRAIRKAVGIAAGATKAITSGPDISYLGRQGFKTLINNPEMWKRNAMNSFRAAASGFKKNSADAVMRQVNASIVSRPDYPEMVRGGLALGVHEEAYPSSLPQRIPYLGKVYSASDAAFSSFQQLNRADTFSLLLYKARQAGLEMGTEELQAIARFAGSMTARGNLGSLEDKVGLFNSLFFSPRNAKATIDTFTHAITGAGGKNLEGSAFVRKQAQIALAKYVVAVAAILLLARGLLGQQGVDLDFRGSDAGKIKIRKDAWANKVAGVIASLVGVGVDSSRGDNTTRYEVTASAAGYMTLLIRMALHAINSVVPKDYRIKDTKDTKTGKPKLIPKGIYGLPMVMLQFMENKFSTAASAVNEDLIMQQTRDKQDPTVWSTLKNLFEPMMVRDVLDLTEDDKKK